MYNKVLIVGVISNNGKYEIGEKSKKAVFRTNIISNTTYKTENQILENYKIDFMKMEIDLKTIISTLLKKIDINIDSSAYTIGIVFSART